MPSLRDRAKDVGLAGLSAVGLTLVVQAWFGHDQRDSTPGLAMLIIGAVGATVQAIQRAVAAGREQRREILGTIKQVSEGGSLAVENEALARGWEQLATERAEFEAEKTQLYAQAVAETLHALNERNKGHVKLMLPRTSEDSRGENTLCPVGTAGIRRRTD